MSRGQVNYNVMLLATSSKMFEYGIIKRVPVNNRKKVQSQLNKLKEIYNKIKSS